METIIRLDKVGKSFGKTNDHWAIEDIDLEIAQGQIFGIIGSSGAGKSTLLRCINLLEYPNTGNVWVNGLQLNNLRPKELNQARKKIGMIFQHFNLLSSKTVLENVALPLKLVRTNKHTRHEIARKLLQLVGLSDKENAYPSQLSGGQKQRVAIARALILEPSVLLCDEATSALDPESTFSILQLLQSINHELGITIVLITHEMQVIQQICQKVAVLAQGKIVEIGAVRDVFGQPRSDVTKRLLSFSEIKLD